MKSILFALLNVIAACSLLLAGGGTPPVKNDHVAYSMTLKEQSLKPGMRGTLLISLVPKKGIHVNLDPPMSVKPDTSLAAYVSFGELKIPRDTATEYLKSSEKIELPVTVAKNARPGTLTLKGIFTYFYCSDAEGWCSKFKQPFEVALKVTK